VVPNFVIPIEGLAVPCEWSVGPVRVRPAANVSSELRGGAPSKSRQQWFDDAVRDLHAGAFAEVSAEDLDGALGLVSQAVDILRVFQHVRHYTTRLTQFGVVGDVRRGLVPYAVTDGDRAGQGFTTRGEAIGWSFTDEAEWLEAPVFHWVASAVGAASPSEAQRRALIGVELLSSALVEQRPTLKMVLLVTALEAWLLPRQAGPLTYRLARAVSYFGCGRHADDLCGRTRETCLYLGLDPGRNAELQRLKRLRVKGSEPPWRCAEWHRVVDWYEDRSDVVHGAGPVIAMKDASNSTYWVARWLVEPILTFLHKHPVDPTDALERAFATLPAMRDWEARLGPL
jgi:hypothetical protein